MSLFNDVSQIELMTDALMMTFSVLHYVGKSVVRVLEESMQWIVFMYDSTNDERYQDMLKAEIMAYMNLGFSMPKKNPILESTVNRESILESLYGLRRGKRIGLTKTQVRSMIGKWKPSKTSPMTINQVVDDIIEKVKNRQNGIYRYVCHVGEQDVYELVITDKESFFWDIKNFKFYVFED